MSKEAEASADIEIVDFWAEWCGTCRMIGPVIERIAAGHEDVVLRKVNVAEAAELAETMAVRSLPTLVFSARDGRELMRLSGSMTGAGIEDALRKARAGLA